MVAGGGISTAAGTQQQRLGPNSSKRGTGSDAGLTNMLGTVWSLLGGASPIAAIQVPSLAVSTQQETGLIVCNVVYLWRSNRGTATMMAQLASQRQYCPQVVRGAQLEPACPNTASVFDSLYCRYIFAGLVHE